MQMKPPLHKRLNQAKSIDLIQNRYQRCHREIPTQVVKLQKDEEFRRLYQEYYGRGYRDWTILVAVFNCVANWKAQEARVDMRSRTGIKAFLELAKHLQDDSYPAWRFDREEMDRQIAGFNMTALLAYGFEFRRPDCNPEAVERFLRERMRHFDFDLPHQPLFGDPPGDWPQL